MNEKIWIEVDEIPNDTYPKDKLLIPGHKFIRKTPKKEKTRVVYGDIINCGVPI